MRTVNYVRADWRATGYWTEMRSSVDCIATRNTKDYVKAPILVCVPTEFVKLLTETNGDCAE